MIWSDRNTARISAPLFLYALVMALSLVGCDSPEFAGNFESENIDEANWTVDARSDCRLSLETDQVRVGHRALRVEAPAESRCELVPNTHSGLTRKFLREPFSEDRWYRFSVFVEVLGETPEAPGLTANTIIAQWHSSPDFLPGKEASRGPPLALRIHDGEWGVTYGWDSALKSRAEYKASNWQWLGPVEVGKWTDWEFRVKWDYEEDGVTEVRKNGRLVMHRIGPNTYNDFRGVYLKLGVYHPADHMIVRFDAVEISNEE